MKWKKRRNTVTIYKLEALNGFNILSWKWLGRTYKL